MIKLLYFSVFLIFTLGCSFNKNSKFWTSSEKIYKENDRNFEEVFAKEDSLENELNPNLKLRLKKKN